MQMSQTNDRQMTDKGLIVEFNFTDKILEIFLIIWNIKLSAKKIKIFNFEIKAKFQINFDQ